METQRVENLYVATKIVTAWLEDRRGEPGEDGAEGALLLGYGVRYNDGYESWCPAAKFEEDNILLGAIGHLPAFQQRVIGEAVALDDKIRKLDTWLIKCTAVELTAPLISALDLELLREQYEHMVKYMDVLNKRIASWSDPVDLVKLYGQGDPLIDNQMKGFIEQIADVKATQAKAARELPIQDEDKDSWLTRKLKEASENALDKSDYCYNWTNVGQDTYTIKVPLFNAEMNVMAVVQSQIPDVDITASIKSVSIASISYYGKDVILTNVRATPGGEGAQWMLELAADMADSSGEIGPVRIVINKQTGKMQIFCTHTGMQVVLQVELENLNRRKRGPQYYSTKTTIFVRPHERNLFELIEYTPGDGRLGPIGITGLSYKGDKVRFTVQEQSSGNTDRFIATVNAFIGEDSVGQFGVSVSTESGELLIVAADILQDYQVELSIVRPEALNSETPEQVRAD